MSPRSPARGPPCAAGAGCSPQRREGPDTHFTSEEMRPRLCPLSAGPFVLMREPGGRVRGQEPGEDPPEEEAARRRPELLGRSCSGFAGGLVRTAPAWRCPRGSASGPR